MILLLCYYLFDIFVVIKNLGIWAMLLFILLIIYKYKLYLKWSLLAKMDFLEIK